MPLGNLGIPVGSFVIVGIVDSRQLACADVVASSLIREDRNITKIMQASSQSSQISVPMFEVDFLPVCFGFSHFLRQNFVGVGFINYKSRTKQTNYHKKLCCCQKVHKIVR